MGKLVGCVVAIVGQMQDKVDPRFEKVEEDVASWGGSQVLMSCQTQGFSLSKEIYYN